VNRKPAITLDTIRAIKSFLLVKNVYTMHDINAEKRPTDDRVSAIITQDSTNAPYPIIPFLWAQNGRHIARKQASNDGLPTIATTRCSKEPT
jgi:hypothetical protein